MRVVYGVNRWTNASRAAARHIDMGEGKPLCGGRGRKASWVQDEDEPTCAKCIRLKAAYDAGYESGKGKTFADVLNLQVD